jgi:hypothetical protein
MRTIFTILFIAFFCPCISGQIDINHRKLEIIARKQATYALDFLKKNITFISNKSNPYDRRSYRIDDITSRFQPNAIIQVASKKRPDKRTNLTPYQYFKRIRDYNYDDVFINFAFQNINYSRKINDNTWEVEFNVGQKFQAYRRDRIVYADFTIKTVTIIVVKC